MSLLRAKPLTAGERLRRKGQQKIVSGRRKYRIDNLIVIGASAGGHHALEEILRGVSADIPAALVIILHGQESQTNNLGRWLARFARIPIHTVVDRERLSNGAAFLAPIGKALRLARGMVHVDTTHRATHPTITINRLFESAAKEYGERVIGVVLTGLLRDGTAGLKAVHDAGGLTVVQNPEEAEYGEMPANAMRDLPVTFCLSLSDIGPALDLLARRHAQLETGVALSIRTLEERIALLVSFIGQSNKNEETQKFLVQELTSLKHELHLVRRLLSQESRLDKQKRGAASLTRSRP